eukprot:snap_masked-scaffold_18-processed-gene-4.21-mRNA-1 protein AED:0.06 eAED:0.06 QI:0/-1/0/1/-1/1/1/0/203
MNKLFSNFSDNSSKHNYRTLDSHGDEEAQFNDSETPVYPGSSYVQSFQNRFFSNNETTAADDEDSWFPELSYSTRLTGFLACFSAGFLLSFFSSFNLMSGHLKGFAFVYTTGNIVALFGSTFLVGPKRQYESLFDETRRESTAAYFLFLFLTIFTALKSFSVLIVMPLLLAQWCAGIWYTASFIPYGREAVKKFISSIISCFF